ncbi:MAG TPA: Npt1/Npt2 family nucleotide transporter [Vicinamibacterales bacterium]|nr:Npt1/Npt2 family nucleotide transporter [Vicinamibacterales bacterium]
MFQRLLSVFVEMRREETTTAMFMFAYSYLAMTAYNIIQPLTRSMLISSLGAVNVPWVIFGSGLFIGFLMLGYTRLVSVLPRRWALPITQAGMAAAMLGFWALFRTGGEWVSVAFYVWGLLLGILLISQFWTLANGIYDPRQAKRLFGFIGGGVTLGGMTGAGLTAAIIETVGANTLLLWSAFTLLACAVIVSIILSREGRAAPSAAAGVEEERGVSLSRAFGLLRQSRQIQLIAVVIGFGSLGAALIDQQLNMAAEVFKGAGQEDAIGAFLAQVRFALSAAAFVIQVWITPRIHRYLGIGFALLILPTNLGLTAAMIIVNQVLWAPAVASVMDRSFRYTVDKTTREVLFLPLPTELRQEVKPFVDVTVDRISRGIGALGMLVLIQPWGLSLAWYQLSFVSLALAALWYFMAFRAKREYVASFRQSLERRVVQPDAVRLSGSELSTVETLVQELAHPEPARVVYAIDVLESLDKRNLVTPLLLYHESPRVRTRALGALGAVRGDIAAQWLPQIRRMLGDSEPGVRAAAVGAMVSISHDDAATVARPLLADADPRIRATAAIALAGSADARDVEAAQAALEEMSSDSSDAARAVRREVAAAVRQIASPRFRPLLIPLLYDPAPEVADEAMESVLAAGSGDFVFVPTLVTLLRHRRLKGRARAVLVGYGPAVIPALAHFMRDQDEDVWVRRHIPATLALIPSQEAVDVLVAGLDQKDGFLRYKVIASLERLRREHPEFRFEHDPIEAQVLVEGRSYFTYLSLSENLFGSRRLSADSLLARALTEKMGRTKNRVFLLLSLIYPWRDIVAARWTLEHGDSRSRANASEYLDNLLTGQLRKRILPILEDLPREERVRRGNVLLRTRPRDVEETLLQLINEDDQVVAAAAIDVVRQQQIWSLADDVEHVLAHRDVRDWYVFEAASWALAEHRMPAERRRELWLEPLPAAELAGRLRHLPLFASVSVDELFRIAGAARQVRHDPGTVLLQEGNVPETSHLLLDGRVTCARRDGEPPSVEAPAALGFVEALQGSPMRETVRTTGLAVSLALTTEELRTLLADNTDLVSGLFATLAERAGSADRSVHPTTAARELAALAEGGLGAVEKVLALQHVPLFARVSAEEMRRLAELAAAVPMSEGATLFAESAAPALWLVLSGEVALTSSTGAEPLTARGGEIIGALSTMAGRPLGRSARVVKSGLALRIDRDDLFDLLGERPELLRQMFSGMFRIRTEMVPVP